MSFTYVTGLPNPPHIPATDVAAMQTNCNSISNAITVDHYPFNDGRCGKHQWVRFPNTNSAPNTGATEWSIYSGTTGFPASDGPNTADIFAQAPNNGLRMDLLRSFPGGNPPLDNVANGYTQWFGGVLVQWNIQTFSPGHSRIHATGKTFNIPFPNNVWGMVTGLIIGNGSSTTASNTLAISINGLNSWEFLFNSSSSSGSTDYNGFYWLAYGN